MEIQPIKFQGKHSDAYHDMEIKIIQSKRKKSTEKK